MRFVTSLIALLLAKNAGAWDHCLHSRAVQGIVDNWITLRTADPTSSSYAAIAQSTLAENFSLEDETVTFFFFPGLTGPYVTNRTAYVGAQTVAFTTDPISVPTLTPEIPLIHGCNTIVFRWILNTKVNKVVPGLTAKVGDPISYKGTDILVLKPGTKLIENVYTSADYIREIYQKGVKLCFQRDSSQNPVCADPAPSAR